MLDYAGKKWIIKSKISSEGIDDHTKLRKQYGVDLVLADKQGFYYMLEEILDAEFEDVVEPEEITTEQKIKIVGRRKKKKAKTK